MLYSLVHLDFFLSPSKTEHIKNNAIYAPKDVDRPCYIIFYLHFWGNSIVLNLKTCNNDGYFVFSSFGSCIVPSGYALGQM